MSAESRIAQDVADRQVAMFAMFVGPGRLMPRSALSAASGIPESTLKSWAAGTAMPFHAVLTLSRFLPAEAINMMSEPAGMRLVKEEAPEKNWTAIAANCAREASDQAAMAAKICVAQADGRVDHIEEAELMRCLRRLKGASGEEVEAG